jgi:hypothetical protein
MTTTNDTLFTAEDFKNNCDDLSQLTLALLTLIELGSDTTAIASLARDLCSRSEFIASQANFVSPISLSSLSNGNLITPTGH